MKDNEELYLLNDGKELCLASQVITAGNDIYVVGHKLIDNLLTPIVWKNGIESLQIHNGKDNMMITSIIVDEGNIYACGHILDTDLEQILEAKVWKNENELHSFKGDMELTSVFAYKGSLYISGMETIDKKTVGKVWKDGMLLYQLNTRNIYDDIRIQSIFVMDRKELETSGH